MIEEIQKRRSIRKYKPDAVEKTVIEEIIHAGILAPSSKNRQPWKFVAVTGAAKESMLEVMQKGIQREKERPMLPDSAKLIAGAEYTCKIMQQSPVIIFVINPLGISLQQSLTAEERIYEICNAQSIGAAMENMTLTATEYGLGSLWICDIYFAHAELTEWLQTEGELTAAMAVGYVDEEVAARPRKKLHDIMIWRENR